MILLNCQTLKIIRNVKFTADRMTNVNLYFRHHLPNPICHHSMINFRLTRLHFSKIVLLSIISKAKSLSRMHSGETKSSKTRSSITAAMTNLNVHGKLTNGNSRAISSVTAAKIKQAYELLNSLFQKCSLDEVFVSFNGGKDCTVVLHMLCHYIEKNLKLKNYVLPILYIQPKQQFKEVEEFVRLCTETYPVEIIKHEGKIKAVLEDVCAERPHFKAVLMGVRRTDPHCGNMQPMQPTDPGWAPLIRVNPILDWSCRDVWSYLLEHKVPYCPLYDQGYTSLGDITNTAPNKHLKQVDPVTGEVNYLPAHMMCDDEIERAGRS